MSPLSVEECRRRLDHGLIPAVPVPFRASGDIDGAAQREYISYMAAQPVAGVAVWAHTGRGLHLSREQRLQVLRAWAEARGAEKILVAGVGGSPERAEDYSSYIASAIQMAREALENGAQAFLVYPPRLFHHVAESEALILDYHKQLASFHAPLIVFYLYEAVGGIAYSPDLLRRLFEVPEVLGIKVATLDSVMTFQDIAALMEKEFPDRLLITGEDRFLGYSLRCGARAALVGMGAVCTKLQHDLLQACFGDRADHFLRLARDVDRLSQVLFIPPMEGYIRRVLWALVQLGVIGRDAAHDPWGPGLPESEFIGLGNALCALGELPSPRARMD